LLEVERGFSGNADITNFTHPFDIHFTRSGATFPACDDPIDASW
jgi:hypothetical protein